MTTRSESGGAEASSMSAEGAEERVFAMRDAYGEGRIPDPASLLRQIDLLLAASAGLEDQAYSVGGALRKAFGERGVEGAALRSEIETLVEGGDMTPSAAESWAKTFGWPHFAEWADPATFDPMAQEFWTLPMTAAWIRWHRLDRSGQAYIDDETDKDATKDYWRKRDYARVVEQVRRHWDAYIAQSTRWVEVEHSALVGEEDHLSVNEDAACRALERARLGYIIAPREGRGWSDLPGETTETKHILCEALKSKSLQAQRYCDGAFKPIPSNEWSALTIIGFHDDDGVHKVFSPDRAEYLAVRVPRVEVIAAFPFPMLDQEGGGAIQAVAATIENVKAELQRDAHERNGKVLGQTKALAHIKARRFVGRDLQGTVRRAVQELSGGRHPGER